MRILHILDHSLPLHSGYTFRTVAILREQRALGYETEHLTTPRHQRQNAALEERADGWLFHRTPFQAGRWSRLPVLGPYIDEMNATSARLDQLVERFNPDVLHAHSPVLCALPALQVARKKSIPVVYEVRASWEDAAVDHGSTKEGSLRYRASRALETYALRRADAITTICEGLRQDIEQRGVRPECITVIPNAVDIGKFRFGVEPDPILRTRLGLNGATTVGFAGSFYGYEGLDLLIDAVAILAPSHPALRVLLVGGGPKERSLQEQVVRLGLRDRIIFTGRVPHAEVQRYYDLIDVLVYPRRSMRLTELVTPLKPLEAMAMGRIVVASDVGGHRELIHDGYTGHLFKAGDVVALSKSIADVISSRPQWDIMRKQARQFVETDRTWVQSVERYEGVYRRICSSRAAARPSATHPSG